MIVPATVRREEPEATSEAPDVVALTVRVPRKLRQQLRVHAAEHGKSVQQCTVEAVQAWLEQHKHSSSVLR